MMRHANYFVEFNSRLVPLNLFAKRNAKMAKKSSIEKNKNRANKVAMYSNKRSRLKAIVNNRELPIEERFRAGLKLNEMPRNGAKIRLRNRCEVSGRPRGYYRKFKMSRIALRDLGSAGQVPGLVKSSW